MLRIIITADKGACSTHWSELLPVEEHSAVSVYPHLSFRKDSNLGFFRKLQDEYLTEHRHDDPRLQHEYNKRLGLVLKK